MSIIPVNPNLATNAYQNAAKVGALGVGAVNQASESGGINFGDLLTSGVQKVIDSQKQSETATAQAVLGKADLTDVVSAVNDAEMTLNTFVALRDKFLEAYDKIIRMPI
jgi:flagellar hook-basal body complex protein FliE